jgi:uncharacterized protein (TIGR02001 family)
MKKNPRIALLATLAGLAALPGVARAEDPPASSVAFNVGVFSEYRYRGISQSKLKPAVQGGVDYTNGGFYLGAWASTIKWIKEFGGDADVEIDLYGGYKGSLTKELSYDVGVLTYQYPGNKLKPIGGANANTTEIYGALTYGPATLKYSHAVTDTFANFDSKGSYYLDLSASFEVTDGWTLAPHVGHQRIDGPNSGTCSYWDSSLTLSKDFKGIVPSVALVGTSKAKDACYTVKGKDWAKSTVVVGVKYNF